MSRTPKRILVLGLAAIVGGLALWNPFDAEPLATPPGPRPGAAQPAAELELGPSSSGKMVAANGRVQRLLADDRDGSRHQRFIMALDSGATLLIAHNIDLAPRLDGLAVGDAVEVRGEYEWNEKGGLVHWTHHDPDGNHPAGYIEWRGRRYQ